MVDKSSGYEGVAAEFERVRSTTVGVARVRNWAKALPRGAAVVDLGCGPGVPLTEVLVAQGLRVYGIDAAPSFVQAFRRNLPNTPVACEAVQDSTFFGRTSDGVLAWGLMFLLSAEECRRRLAAVQISILGEYQDEGRNHYFDAVKEMKTIRPTSEHTL